jgi:hypothetical protein
MVEQAPPEGVLISSKDKLNPRFILPPDKAKSGATLWH